MSNTGKAAMIVPAMTMFHSLIWLPDRFRSATVMG